MGAGINGVIHNNTKEDIFYSVSGQQIIFQKITNVTQKSFEAKLDVSSPQIKAGISQKQSFTISFKQNIAVLVVPSGGVFTAAVIDMDKGTQILNIWIGSELEASRILVKNVLVKSEADARWKISFKAVGKSTQKIYRCEQIQSATYNSIYMRAIQAGYQLSQSTNQPFRQVKLTAQDMQELDKRDEENDAKAQQAQHRL